MVGNQWMRYGLASLFLVFACVPGRRGFLDGIPLEDSSELLLIFAVLTLCVFFPLTAPQGKWGKRILWGLATAFLAVTAMKASLGILSLPRGFSARYAVTGSTATANRIDPVIAFKSGGYARNAMPFPLWFVNDRELLNQEGLDRPSLPVTAEWNGYAVVRGTRLDVELTSDGKAAMEINGVPYAEFTAWQAGTYPIRVRYTAGEARDRFISLTDRKTGLPFTEIFPQAYSEKELAYDAIIGKIGKATMPAGLFIFLLMLMALSTGAPWKSWFVSRGPWTLILGAICLAGVLAYAFPATASPYFNMFYSGSDELTYETFARHMRLTGDWGMARLEREAYYYQLYYYFVAGMHYVLGEGFLTIFIAQAALLVAAAFVLASSMRRMICTETRAATPVFFAAAAGIALMPELAKESAYLLPTVLGIFFSAIAVTALMAAKGADGKKSAALYALAGAALGAGTLNRYNFLAWIPFLAAYALAQYGKKGLMPLAALSAGTLALLAPFILRNGITAGQWRLVSQSNTTANFLLGTPVPADFKPRVPVVTAGMPLIRSVFDERADRPLSWIREEPVAYLSLLYGKAKTAILTHPVLWFIFCISSAAWLTRPTMLGADLTRADYLVYGGFVMSQFVTITLASTGNARYYFVITPFLVLFAGLLGAMLARSMNSLFHSSKQSNNQIR